jgi:hypothetical protein
VREPAADGARLHRWRCPARLADRPVVGPRVNTTAPAAAHARLQVRRVGRVAVPAQRASLQIAGGRFANLAAAAAFHFTGLAGAGAADPRSVAVLDQRNSAPATGATGRANEGSAPCAEVVNEQQHRVGRRVVP